MALVDEVWLLSAGALKQTILSQFAMRQYLFHFTLTGHEVLPDFQGTVVLRLNFDSDAVHTSLTF